MDKIMIIYHHPCSDGFVAMCIARNALAGVEACGFQIETRGMNYHEEPPRLQGYAFIYILDFSFSREILEEYIRLNETVIILDHHKTAEDELKGLPGAVFDMNKSGAMLTWEHFHASDPPDLVRYVQDRDLWKWELEDSMEYSAGLRLNPFDYEVWKHWLVHSPHLTRGLIQEGRIVLRYQNQCVVDAAVNHAYRVSYGDAYVPIINCTHLVSEIVGTLADKEPFAIGYFLDKDKAVFSLRSNEHGLDVSSVAKDFGGGGHKHAAGFTLPLSEGLVLLSSRSFEPLDL